VLESKVLQPKHHVLLAGLFLRMYWALLALVRVVFFSCEYVSIKTIDIDTALI
jgi:hypothetical protein